MLKRTLLATMLVFGPRMALAQAIPAPADPDTLQAKINVLNAERDQLEQNLSALLVQLNKTGKDLSDCKAKLPKEAQPSAPGAASTAPAPSATE